MKMVFLLSKSFDVLCPARKELNVLTPFDARNHFSLNFCHYFGCGSDVVQMWLDVAGMWFGGGSDVFSDLVHTVWQKLRESGFQHFLSIFDIF